MTTSIKNFGPRRALTHVGLALFTIVGCWAYHTRLGGRGDILYTLTIPMGYLSLALIVVSLMIGPIQLLRQRYRRRNPVNIHLRRDVGIWAGIDGCLHVGFALFTSARGNILSFFLEPSPRGYRLDLGLFGISNDVGAIATLVLAALLVLSNNLSLRKLKGKRWKTIQRFNYLLAALVFFHTYAYQFISRRDPVFTSAATSLMMALLAAQTVGFAAYRVHRRAAMETQHRDSLRLVR